MHARLEISGRRWTLAAMTATLTLIFLDQTAVSVALPSIQGDLGASHTELAWVMNAFMLSLAALAAAGGRLGDVAGRRRCSAGDVLNAARDALAAGLETALLAAAAVAVVAAAAGLVLIRMPDHSPDA